MFVVLLLIGLVVLGGCQREAAAKRQREELAQAHVDQQAAARAMIDGSDPQLYRLQLFDPSLRCVQVIAESMHLVRTTTNPRTRSTRINTIERTIETLDEMRWDGLDDDVQAHVRAAVTLCAQQAVALAAAQESEKHVRAAQRAVTDRTRMKYAALAIATLEVARSEIVDPGLQAGIDRAIESIQPLLHAQR